MDILVVDDEKEIVDLIALYLRNEDYNVHKFYKSSEVLKFLDNNKIDLAILDIMMPDIDGFELCKEIRKKYNFPILFLTEKVEDIDKVNGFNIGGDDYITKPFTPIELVARIKAHLRRYKKYDQQVENIIDFRDILIDKNNHTVTVKNKQLNLTPKEFSIFSILCENKGQVVTAEKLYESVWGEKYLPSANNTIMVHIRHLREKMDDATENPKYIKTVWGIGYEVEK